MGNEASQCDPSLILNTSSRQFFENVQSILSSPQENSSKAKLIGKLARIMYDSLKHTPAEEKEFSLIITGQNIGPTFFDCLWPKLNIPANLTKISFRNSGLKKVHCPKIALLLTNVPTLRQLDASENDFGDSAVCIIKAATGHPNLVSLQLEECKLTDSISNELIDLLNYNRKLETLRIAPFKLTGPTGNKIKTAALNNQHLTNISINQMIDPTTAAVSDRNNFIFEFVDSIARSPYQRQFRTKIDAFKSVKGREMLMGRAKQKETARGTDLFTRLEQVDERARTKESNESVEKTDKLRSGHAETIGRRPAMEDVSIILPNMPTADSSLFGVFDGHGGREAAEFASQQLPKSIAEYLKRGDSPADAYKQAFQKTQMDMRPWCVYVGSTCCLAQISSTTITVANIGDTRAVLCRDGKALRLSVDHKPYLPEEQNYVESRGGFVRDGRVGGMLAVSRAFGDGFLGDSINPVPHFVEEKLTPADQFLIIACDGVWDVIPDQKACDIVLGEIDPLSAAKKLRDTAFELESSDNISVIVVSFSELQASRE
ncbi:protein phosphatase 2C, putative [Trichomonas vaginalis G3]|uniref:Protein phosphatase 2C, putative n=1 Tax=Trichomonas vaginalis (strain ATCC PRA-98 / G3) TaxID=412133 RepID=A2E4A5_TRIV3|nr:protein phosphatase 2C family [Trichomonas vaginalis G3]EAY12551.1 protein phosphatase 2C, putative [Trichomonas vaginalis G3]KAI5554093.1 protein phosphatase 2C family [Trichomonas vaginalis G3]|eukprot:XP_001324774.1 protein phosphatase 2C [Trichomonas vaginalis G3]